jgi:hypothetical protein
VANAQTCSGPATTVALADSVRLDHDRLMEPLRQHATAAEQQQLLGNVRAIVHQMHLECGYRVSVSVTYYPDIRMYGVIITISHGDDRGALHCVEDTIAVPFVLGTLPEQGEVGRTHRYPRGSTPIEATEDALQHGQRICGVRTAL